MTETTGALVIGGNLNGLSIARSLGRHGVPVWVTTPPNAKLASCSRYTLRTLPWPDGESEAQVGYLLELAARYDLDQWVLFPTSDESAALLSKFHTALSRRFLVSTPTWEALRWAYDKRLTYQLAAEQKVDYPLTIYPARIDSRSGADPWGRRIPILVRGALLRRTTDCLSHRAPDATVPDRFRLFKFLCRNSRHP